ncbi:MAG: hypothetical protein Q7T57_01570, partial [Dehalococcoidales bacterium]|nr:hypothetical protein [Dehalococcoidales bacterium]
MKKKKHLARMKEEAKRNAANELVTKDVKHELGALKYDWKNQFGFKFSTTENIPSKDVGPSVTPTPLSTLDWTEPEPIDPALLPRAPIDYELLAAVFS